MDTNKILSADMLDLIFDDRNKDYGAYELRRTYPQRVKKALLFTALIGGTVFTGVVLANTLKPEKKFIDDHIIVSISEIPLENEPEVIPEPERPEPEPLVQTERLISNIAIVEDQVADETLPTQDDLNIAEIGLEKQSGIVDDGITDIKTIDKLNIIEEPKPQEDVVHWVVQVPAMFEGNWEKFLRRNLRGDVPVENNAPPGSYRVLVQFVVDQQGNVSDIVPLTSHGYGMEEEAVRVLRKATGWKAGIQNGREVKSYHKQPITFVVEQE